MEKYTLSTTQNFGASKLSKEFLTLDFVYVIQSNTISNIPNNTSKREFYITSF